MPFSYFSAEKGMCSTTNIELGSGNIYNPYTNITTKTYAPQTYENNNLSDLQCLEPSIIFYIVNQSVDPYVIRQKCGQTLVRTDNR